MSYYVEYNPELSKMYPVLKKNSKKSRVKWLVVSFIAIASLCCLNRKEVWEFMIPGDSAITVQATEVLLQQVRDGASLVDAITVFCETVVSGEG